MVNLINILFNLLIKLTKMQLYILLLKRNDILYTTLCDKVCWWLATGRLFSPSTPVSSTNKTDRYDIAILVLKVALNTITLAIANMLVLNIQLLLNNDGILIVQCKQFLIITDSVDIALMCTLNSKLCSYMFLDTKH
jgi:hypothetical protein